MPAYGETEGHSWLHNRHSEKVPIRSRRYVSDRLVVIMPFNNDRAITMLDINRSGSIMRVIMMRLCLLIVAIGVTTAATIIFPAIREANAAANEDHNSCNC